MMQADVTVMGAGVIGLSCAWAMARRGARVRVIERQAPGAGASGGVMGALSPHVPERWDAAKEFQLESLLGAEAFWAGVREASGRDPLFARTGRVQPLADENAVRQARARAASAGELWGGRAEWRVAAADRFGLASPTGLVAQDSLSGRISPRAAIGALAAALLATGGEIVTGDAPMGAGPVIWATGVAGLQALSAEFGRDMGSGVGGAAALLAHAATGAPQVYAGGLYIVPHGDGTVAVGSTTSAGGADADTGAPLDPLIHRARALWPALAQAPVLERWAGARPRAATGKAVLGPWPGRAGQFIANGGFRTGLGLAPRIGEVMADLVLAGRDAIPAPLRAERLLERAAPG